MHSNLNSPRDLCERAINSPRGIRVQRGNKAECVALKNRISAMMTKDRKKSVKVWSPDQPGYNKTPYDALSFHIVNDNEGRWWVYINSEWSPNEGLIVEEL